MKLVINSSLSSDAIHDELASGDTKLQKTNQMLSHMFKGEDILSGIKGFHNEEAKQLSREIFSTLFENPNRVESQSSWAKCIIDSLQNTQVFRQLKKHCLYDRYKASAATIKLIHEIKFMAKELRSEQKQEQLDFDDPDMEVEFDEDQIEDLEDLLSGFAPQMIDEFNEDDELGKMLGLGHDLSDASPKKGKGIGRNLLNSVKRNPSLMEVFKKAGSLLEAMESKKVKDQNCNDNLTGIIQGRNLRHLTTGSRNLLCDPVTENLFYDKFCRNQLDIFDYEGEIDKSRGPIMLLVDESGSMQGNRFLLAKAIAVAFAHLATKEKRNITIVFFNSSVSAVYTIKDKKCVCLGNGEKFDLDFSVLLNAMATKEVRGGTNFDKPFNKAFDLNPLEDKADMIMVTDGNAPISIQTIEKIESYKREGMKFYSILLGISKTSLDKFSDQVIDIEAMGKADQDLAVGSVMYNVKG